ncbi:MAG: tRNA pseudouridine(55) synthase TruB [Candidatus Margulisiibacteriota bacterium]|nr:tRNA pseudouridine(55) synthase TruB [Candidatus Margulisiibacteriota bacterium]
MDGIIIVNKPQGWTSFDVCAKIRNLSRTKKVGHSGTLDPNATGVLPIFIGKATKSIQHFMSGDKGYLAEMTLGIRTDTLDSDGQIISNDKCQITNKSSIKEIEEIIKKYKGEILQTPPMYSAVKVKGKRLYKLAREGIEVKREPRKVTVHSIKLINFEAGEHPKVTIEVMCTKGTYIRQLASDIGDDLGCGAHLSKLMRTYARPFHITQAVNMDTIITLAKVGRLESVLIPTSTILPSPLCGEGGPSR